MFSLIGRVIVYGFASIGVYYIYKHYRLILVETLRAKT